MTPMLPTKMQAFGTLELAARLSLSALCRSSLLRLRADAFTEVGGVNIPA